MTAYICYLLLAGMQLFLFCREGKLKRKYFNTKKYLIICCAELIVLAGIRGYTVGADTETYLMAVDYYSSMSSSELISAKLVYPFDFEIGYFLLTKLCVFLGIGKTGFLFVVALIIYIPVFHTIKKHSHMPYVSILTYFAFGLFSFSLGILRQMIAVSILLLGWDFVVERRMARYILLVLFAMTFHTTAAIGIFLYFLYEINWKRVLLVLIPLETVLVFLGRRIVILAISIFPKYAGFIGGVQDVQGGSYLMLILLNAVLYMSVLFHGNRNNEADDMTYCALILSICLQCLGYAMGIFGRIVSYYSIYLIIAIPSLIHNIRNKIGYKWRGCVSLGAIICLFILTIISFEGNKYVVPYYTFWNEI